MYTAHAQAPLSSYQPYTSCNNTLTLTACCVSCFDYQRLQEGSPHPQNHPHTHAMQSSTHDSKMHCNHAQDPHNSTHERAC